MKVTVRLTDCQAETVKRLAAGSTNSEAIRALIDAAALAHERIGWDRFFDRAVADARMTNADRIRQASVRELRAALDRLEQR